MHILFYISIIILSGLLLAKIMSYIKLPHVTGYLIAGILIGPYVLHLVPKDVTASLVVLSEFALGIIAYNIGSTLNIKRIRKTEKGVLTIALFESLGAFLIVSTGMVFIFRQSFSFSIIIGSIAAATAPAATIMIIRQYHARGKLVDTLLPVVALDNAISIILFNLMVTIARSLGNAGAYNIDLVGSLNEIFSPILLGLVLGLFLSFLFDRLKGKDELLCLVLVMVCLGIGIAQYLNISSMMLCLVIGAVVTNLSLYNVKALSAVDRFTPPIFVMFFVLASLKLDLVVFMNVGWIAGGYVLIRVLGKLLGAKWGTHIAGSSSVIQSYLGYTLIPQAGVAIGLSLLAELKLPEYGASIRTIIIASTIVYEIIGPVIAKIALIKARQIGP